MPTSGAVLLAILSWSANVEALAGGGDNGFLQKREDGSGSLHQEPLVPTIQPVDDQLEAIDDTIPVIITADALDKAGFWDMIHVSTTPLPGSGLKEVWKKIHDAHAPLTNQQLRELANQVGIRGPPTAAQLRELWHQMQPPTLSSENAQLRELELPTDAQLREFWNQIRARFPPRAGAVPAPAPSMTAPTQTLDYSFRVFEVPESSCETRITDCRIQSKQCTRLHTLTTNKITQKSYELDAAIDGNPLVNTLEVRSRVHRHLGGAPGGLVGPSPAPATADLRYSPPATATAIAGASTEDNGTSIRELRRLVNKIKHTTVPSSIMPSSGSGALTNATSNEIAKGSSAKLQHLEASHDDVQDAMRENWDWKLKWLKRSQSIDVDDEVEEAVPDGQEAGVHSAIIGDIGSRLRNGPRKGKRRKMYRNLVNSVKPCSYIQKTMLDDCLAFNAACMEKVTSKRHELWSMRQEIKRRKASYGGWL